MRLLFVLVFGLFLVACGNTNFMGAQKYVTGGGYTTRWFLNKEHDLANQPKGTAFYGVSAEKIKHRYTIKYYVSDNAGDEIEIPKEHMWKLIPDVVMKNRSSWIYKNIYMYKKVGDSYVLDFQVNASVTIWAGGGVKLIPIQSCDNEGWCKTYIWIHDRNKTKLKYNFDDVYYIKKQYLYQGEDRLFESQKRELKKRDAKVKVALPPFISPSKEVCINNNGRFTRNNSCRAIGRYISKICIDSGGRVPEHTDLIDVVSKCGGPVNDRDLPKPHEKNSVSIDNYESCYLQKGFNYLNYFTSDTKDSESAAGQPMKSVRFVSFAQGVSWWSSSDWLTEAGNVMCYEDSK